MELLSEAAVGLAGTTPFSALIVPKHLAPLPGSCHVLLARPERGDSVVREDRSLQMPDSSVHPSLSPSMTIRLGHSPELAVAFPISACPQGALCQGLCLPAARAR